MKVHKKVHNRPIDGYLSDTRSTSGIESVFINPFEWGIHRVSDASDGSWSASLASTNPTMDLTKRVRGLICR